MKKNYLLVCDWGTTSFRLRLIGISDQAVVGEVLSSEGIAHTYDAWRASGSPESGRQPFYTNRLKKQVSLLEQQTGLPLQGVEIVVSGMATSSIGICEVPYTQVPFRLDGKQVSLHRLSSGPDFPHNMLLISGVRSEHDVIRGEETQLLGLSNLLGHTATHDSIFILPGTHSKHLHVRQDHLVGIRTFMTGELFSLLSRHSILGASVETPDNSFYTEQDLNAFRMGVRESKETIMLNQLFRVRTNELFHKLDKRENSFFLSGLLVGNELRYLAGEDERQLILCSGSSLSELYSQAFQVLDLSRRSLCLPSETIDLATIAGQVKVFQNETLSLTSPIL